MNAADPSGFPVVTVQSSRLGRCSGRARLACSRAGDRTGVASACCGRRRFLRPANGPNQLCLFPDTRYYWDLGQMIRSAGTYEIVEWSDIPHFALRTPGYPLFLAACQRVLGQHTLAVRLVQAVLGTLSVYLIYRLTRHVVAGSKVDGLVEGQTPGWSAPLVAALIAAVGPYYVSMSSLILSEAVFEPLMLTALWRWLWSGPSLPGKHHSHA